MFPPFIFIETTPMARIMALPSLGDDLRRKSKWEKMKRCMPCTYGALASSEYYVVLKERVGNVVSRYRQIWTGLSFQPEDEY